MNALAQRHETPAADRWRQAAWIAQSRLNGDNQRAGLLVESALNQLLGDPTNPDCFARLKERLPEDLHFLLD